MLSPEFLESLQRLTFEQLQDRLKTDEEMLAEEVDERVMAKFSERIDAYKKRLDDFYINYFNFMVKVRWKVLELVVAFVNTDKAGGTSKKQRIKDALAIVYSNLNVDDKIYPTDIEGIVEEIERSEDFQNWSADIRHLFHKGGILIIKTPISFVGNKYQNVIEEVIEIGDDYEPLAAFIDFIK